MFKEVGSIEKYGSGIARIKRECQQHGIIAPIFEKFQHGFQVTLYKQKNDNSVNEGISEGIYFLYDYIKQNPSKRVSHIQKQLKTPAKTIERWIKQFREEGKIEYRGRTKTGGYYVK
jgi:ATP-dependent DNA helicase RecG